MVPVMCADRKMSPSGGSSPVSVFLVSSRSECGEIQTPSRAGPKPSQRSQSRSVCRRSRCVSGMEKTITVHSPFHSRSDSPNVIVRISLAGIVAATAGVRL